MSARKTLKARLRNRETLFGVWLSFAHPSIAEMFAMVDFNFLAIDMEHTPISVEQAQRIIAASQAKDICCLPRLVSHSNDWIKPTLDSGADGLIVQMVDDKNQLDNIVSHLKYPPIGSRSFGVNRAHGYGYEFDEYVSSWNEESILIIQIESRHGVENIDELLDNNDVDGVMVGPYDMSGSYGVPGETSHDLVKAAADKVVNACIKKNISCGWQIADPTDSSVQEILSRGFNFIFMGSDLFLIWKWGEQMNQIIQQAKSK